MTRYRRKPVEVEAERTSATSVTGVEFGAYVVRVVCDCSRRNLGVHDGGCEWWFPRVVMAHDFEREYEPVPEGQPTGSPPRDCRARKAYTDPPMDCDWPFCGCDPAAENVIAALQECDALKDAETERETAASLKLADELAEAVVDGQAGHAAEYDLATAYLESRKGERCIDKAEGE